jgi:hypothetical protein
MLRGGVAGKGARGGRGAIDEPTLTPLFGWDAYRRRDPGGALVVAATGADDPTLVNATPLYVAGLRQFIGTNPINSFAMADAQGGGMADALYAILQPLPAGRLQRLVYACTGNAPAGGNIRMHLWSVKAGAGSDNLFPYELLYDSGSIAFTTLGPKSAGAISGGLRVTAGLYAFSIAADATAASGIAQGPAVPETAIYPVNGLTVRWGNGEPAYNSSLCIGWRHAQAFGTPPNTFPDSAPRRLVLAAGDITMPAIFYGFDPD